MNFGPINHCVVQGLKLALMGALCTLATRGQDITPQFPAPPPMRVIPHDEHNQIKEAKDAKARVLRTVELAELHLQRAEGFASRQEYSRALTELGGYVALIDDGLTFLSKLDDDPGKNRKLYKYVELALRAQGPRLTVMRRATPLEYAIRIKEAEDFARDGRTEALNAFYGHTVVRDGRQKKPEEDNKTKDPNKPERQP